jgi:hypothetical protein
MGKKKTAAKTIQLAPPASLQDFEAEITATLNDDRIEMQREFRYLKQHKHLVYEEIMNLGREEGFLKAKEGFTRALKVARMTQSEIGKIEREKGYEKGLKDGEERGRVAEREKWETKRESEDAQPEPTTRETTDSSTQTTPTTTVDAVMQTAPNDEPPCLLNDAGTSTETSSTCETGVQANETPTSPSLPQPAATSLPMTPTQPPSDQRRRLRQPPPPPLLP